MDMKLEVIGLPVSDVDAAKAFYVERSALCSTTTTIRSRAYAWSS